MRVRAAAVGAWLLVACGGAEPVSRTPASATPTTPAPAPAPAAAPGPAAEPAVEAGPRPTGFCEAPCPARFTELFGEALEVTGVRPLTGVPLQRPGIWLDVRARAPGTVDVGLRDLVTQEVMQARIVVQEPGPRELPPERANAVLCVGDTLELAVPTEPGEWVQATPPADRWAARTVIGPLRRRDVSTDRRLSGGAPVLTDPRRVREAGQRDWSWVRFVAAQPGSTYGDWVVSPAGAPVRLRLLLEQSTWVFMPVRVGDIVYIRREVVDPGPNDPIAAPEGL